LIFEFSLDAADAYLPPITSFAYLYAPYATLPYDYTDYAAFMIARYLSLIDAALRLIS